MSDKKEGIEEVVQFLTADFSVLLFPTFPKDVAVFVIVKVGPKQKVFESRYLRLQIKRALKDNINLQLTRCQQNCPFFIIAQIVTECNGIIVSALFDAIQCFCKYWDDSLVDAATFSHARQH
uniref:Arp2/3 complex 34 kDa subunit n=1 Tax=Mesocestoides corti TaxID=53468 RepID=A0A5K3FU79_MESCO